MICSLALGRKGSVGFPGKNRALLRGKPVAEHVFTEVKKCQAVTRHFLSTDDENLSEIARSHGFEIIERPPFLATAEALGEDAYKHGYEQIVDTIGQKPEFLILLFCNAPTFNLAQIEEGIDKLRADPSADSAVTVSRYNMFSPVRARQINSDGLLDPYIPFEKHPKSEDINCDRDSQGDVWFADVSLCVVRPKNLEYLEQGVLPQRWMGRRIIPIKNDAGLDIDYPWQLGQLDWWLANKRKCN